MDHFFFSIFPIVFVCMLAFIVYSAVKNYAAAKARGVDPLTMQTELQVKALQSDVLRPERTMEQRLAEVDDLHARGVISADEHAAARSRILTD